MSDNNIVKKQNPTGTGDYAPLIPQTEACDRRLAKKEKSFRKGVVALIVFFAILLLLGIAIAVVLIVSYSMKSKVAAANQPKQVSNLSENKPQTQNGTAKDGPQQSNTFIGNGIKYNKV